MNGPARGGFAYLALGGALLDLLLPRKSGLEVQAELAERNVCHAVALITGFGDVPDAVRAMRAGAIDFLRKPYRRSELFEVVARAAAHVAECERQREAASRFEALKRLSLREREVLTALERRLSTKQVARELGVSAWTIDMHRANIMRKRAMTSIAEALLLARDAAAASTVRR
ncbi:LuxR C-terminal-related transcriptional regulator [uncultured Sphingomonas sp.]|uniref:response regulator transcription factor n=1 Tax=uncultured Sphingomonas sp. TaxID=158754 RepID=UPI0025D79151|nr:LuxR C-terminal-related transcriptional regulator [uncultured Sphingomonas sp.]